jgi:hypothetical protein
MFKHKSGARNGSGLVVLSEDKTKVLQNNLRVKRTMIKEEV